MCEIEAVRGYDYLMSCLLDARVRACVGVWVGGGRSPRQISHAAAGFGLVISF